MVREILPGLMEIKIDLGNSPLKNLNSYVILGEDRHLLIDTGFNRPECLADLRGGLDEIGVDMEKTDIFITHFHADHCGLLGAIATPDTRVYMSEVDKNMLEGNFFDKVGRWQVYDRLYKQEGYPATELEQTLLQNPSRNEASEKLPTITPLAEGDILQVGSLSLSCISTPGHTPGHMCLYEPKSQMMILGDHVLFDISPNITAWPQMPDALAHYLDSLKKIRDIPVKTPLPGHRGYSVSMKERVDELLQHHHNRLEETQNIVAQNSGINAFDVAGKMRWSIRAKDWASFPPTQKWFAVGETLAHLYYLTDKSRMERTVINGIAQYRISMSPSSSNLSV